MTYYTVHDRLRRTRGKATSLECVQCGERARDWAYQHTSSDEKIDPRTGRVYSEDPSAYDPMCRKCHISLDNLKTPHVGSARREGARRSAEKLTALRRSDSSEGDRLRGVSRENAKTWNTKVREHRERDPEFDAKMREHHVRLGVANIPVLQKAWSKPGPRGSTKTNKMRRVCADCGKESSPGPMSLHLSKTGHSGYTPKKEAL